MFKHQREIARRRLQAAKIAANRAERLERHYTARRAAKRTDAFSGLTRRGNFVV